MNIMIQETFKPAHLLISEIFKNQDSFYQIPNYQRSYSWESEQVEQMWDDLCESYETNAASYFLGSIIVTPSEGEYFDVIDGQQRITTLIILFCVARATGILSEKMQKKIENAISDNEEGRARLKFITRINQQNAFQHDIIENKELQNIKASKKEREENKYKNTAIIFNKKIKDIDNELEGFIEYIFNQTTMIKINCSNKFLAIKLFRALNDRGMDLTQSDLIKSFLLEKLEASKHRQFDTDWDKIENKMKDNTEATMENLLSYYEYYLLASNPKKSLSEEIENWIRENSKNPMNLSMRYRSFPNFL